MLQKDTLQFLSKLTPNKIGNALAILISYYVSLLIKKPIVWGKPFTLSIEPTTHCNLGCPECPSGLKSFSRPTGHMNSIVLDTVLQETSKHLMYMYFYFQGEPYMHPEFCDMVSKANQKGIYTVTSTNAHFLTPRKAADTVRSGLSRILISVDGTTQDVYSQYRVHGQLHKVLEGIRNLVQAKKEAASSTPHIIIQFLVVKPNEHQIEDVYKLANELGVDDVKLKSAQIYTYKDGNHLIPENEAYSRYKQNKDGTYSIKNKLLNQCWKMWHSAVITWDGNMVPCCFDKDASYTMGNITKHSIHDIWHNKSYTSFRTKLLKSRKEIDICTNCTEGTKVWVNEAI